MKSNIIVGPIQKSQPSIANPISGKIQENLKKMKVGNFFEVKGLSTTRELNNLRAGISYFSKRSSIRVETSFKSGVLTIMRTKKVNKTSNVETV